MMVQPALPISFDVFLSYSSVDQPWVIKLKNDLLRYGVSVWLDKDEIRPGDLFGKALEQALENCRAVALIVSPAAIRSNWVEEEYYRALSLAKTKRTPVQIIPVILGKAELPGFLQDRNWVDFRDETAYAQNVWKLVWGITGKKPAQALDMTSVAPIQSGKQIKTMTMSTTTSKVVIAILIAIVIIVIAIRAVSPRNNGSLEQPPSLQILPTTWAFKVITPDTILLVDSGEIITTTIGEHLLLSLDNPSKNLSCYWTSSTGQINNPTACTNLSYQAPTSVGRDSIGLTVTGTETIHLSLIIMIQP